MENFIVLVKKKKKISAFSIVFLVGGGGLIGGNASYYVNLRNMVFDQKFSVHTVSEYRRRSLSMTHGGGAAG